MLLEAYINTTQLAHLKLCETLAINQCLHDKSKMLIIPAVKLSKSEIILLVVYISNEKIKKKIKSITYT